MFTIRPLEPSDWPAVWSLFQEVIQGQDAFVFAPDHPEVEAKQLWTSGTAFVAEEAGQILGSFYIKPNQPGLGNHIANAGFMVSSAARGRGLGRLMGERALELAREMGYTAMQFNFVVSSNTAAVQLWESLGFQIIGTIPNAFRHGTLGPVDVLIMHRKL